MKSKILFFVFFLFQTIAVLAQDMASLKTEALKSYKASVNMNFDAIFETTYPKVFDIIPQDQMKKMFGQMMENEQFSIKLVEVEPNFSFGEIKKIEGKSFCMVNYNNVMTMKFKEPMDDAESMVDIFKTLIQQISRCLFTFDTTRTIGNDLFTFQVFDFLHVVRQIT